MKFIHQPYPFYYSFKRTLFFSVGSGLFVFLFLIYFQPFGTYTFEHLNKTAFLFGYGVIVSLCMLTWLVVVPLLVPSQFKEERWTIAKQIVLLSLLIITIATTCYLYQINFFSYSFSWRNWFSFIEISASIGLFPLGLLTILDYYVKLKKYKLPVTEVLQSKASLSAKKIFLLVAENGKDKIAFTEEELLFVKSDDNYVEIYLRRDKMEVDKKILRLSLKSVEADLVSDSFVRCHRSFIVNLRNCYSIKGNSQGHKLLFEGIAMEIPVARAKSDDVRRRLLEK